MKCEPGPIISLVAAIVLQFSCCQSDAADLKELQPVPAWNNVANGIWSATLGDVDGVLRYTDLAGGAPRMTRLNALSKLSLPKSFSNVRFRITSDHKAVVHIPTSKGEKIYGYGLQFDGIEKTDRILDLKVDHFNKGGGATHAPVPFFVSSRGYGVFFNTSKFIKVYNQVGNRKDSPNNPPEVDRNPPDDEPQSGSSQAQPAGDAVEAYIHGKGLELLVFEGDDMQDVVARYNLYCGGGAMPPLWGLGFWHRVPSKFSAAETEQEIAEFKEHDIPLDVIGLEPGWQTKSYPCTFEWQKKRFPDPAAFSKRLMDDGLRLNLWENPYISKHAAIYPQMYPLSGSHMVWLGIVPDYRLPEARKILIDQHKREHFDIGISGYKIDEVDGYDSWLWPDHATFPSGTSAEVMRQTYGLQMQHMLQTELFRKNDRRTYSLVRASNGAASNYPFVLYSDSYGHQQYITGLSSASLCGVLWCPEIRSAKNSREWINRMHTVCFAPMAMLNAWASGTKPWSFPDATDAVRRTIQLRMKLLPYLYTAFADYNQHGVPPIRAMLLEDGSQDTSVFMFGPDILVAPFHNTDTQRDVQLPRGDWYDFHTGQLAGNGVQITVTAEETQDLPPLFVRSGSLIPMLSKSVNRTREMVGAEIEVRHYGTADGDCTLYEDDGSTFAFADGQSSRRRFSTVRRQDGVNGFGEEPGNQDAIRLYGKAVYRRMTP